MLGHDPDKPTALRFEEPNVTWDELRRASIYSPEDMSFTRQLHEVVDAIVQPHFFLTANSAIPVADSIRGFYAAAMQQTPPIDYIRADFRAASKFWATNQLSAAECHRLKHTRMGLQETAVVVDQRVCSGQTIGYGARLLFSVGFSDVVALRGDWYNDHSTSSELREQVSSTHSKFMKAVGRAAFHKLRKAAGHEHYTNRC